MPAAPHGGHFIVLPGDKGFAELMIERNADRTKARKADARFWHISTSQMERRL